MGTLHLLGRDTLLSEDLVSLEDSDINIIECIYLYSHDVVQRILARSLLWALGHELPIDPPREVA